jgi:predicted RNase H-like HicB family nuclease
MSGHHYTVIIEREDDGTFHAFCPALPGCHSQGDTYEDTVPNEDVIIKPIHVAA